MTEQHFLIPPTPGERLCEMRRAQGWTIEDIARRLKCEPAIVRAMESGDIGRLAPVYRHGFLKNYALLLGLDPGEVRAWLEQGEQQQPELRPVFPVPAGARPGERWLKATSYVMASLLVGTLAWQMTHEAVRLSQTDGRQETVAPVQESAPGTKSGTHVMASIASLETLRPAGSRTGSAGQRAWAALDGGGHETEPPLQAGEHRLQLLASADSWVEIRDREDRLLEQDLVRAGEGREYHGFGPYRITLGRSSAVQLFLDGQAVDLAPFAHDNVVQMQLDPEQYPVASAGESAPQP